MGHPVGACPLYFGIGSPVLDRQQHKSRAPKLEEKGRTDRLTPACRYEGMVDTMVQLFRVYTSGVITPVLVI
jgi:hypothetical protein